MYVTQYRTRPPLKIQLAVLETWPKPSTVRFHAQIYWLDVMKQALYITIASIVFQKRYARRAKYPFLAYSKYEISLMIQTKNTTSVQVETLNQIRIMTTKPNFWSLNDCPLQDIGNFAYIQLLCLQSMFTFFTDHAFWYV